MTGIPVWSADQHVVKAMCMPSLTLTYYQTPANYAFSLTGQMWDQ